MPLDAMVERLQRRTAALERQLEARIGEISNLQARLAEQEPLTQAAADALVHRANEYDALMQTLTMRVLRRPRAWYTTARRRAPGLTRLMGRSRKWSGPSAS